MLQLSVMLEQQVRVFVCTPRLSCLLSHFILKSLFSLSLAEGEYVFATLTMTGGMPLSLHICKLLFFERNNKDTKRGRKLLCFRNVCKCRVICIKWEIRDKNLWNLAFASKFNYCNSSLLFILFARIPSFSAGTTFL